MSEPYEGYEEWIATMEAKPLSVFFEEQINKLEEALKELSQLTKFGEALEEFRKQMAQAIDEVEDGH